MVGCCVVFLVTCGLLVERYKLVLAQLEKPALCFALCYAYQCLSEQLP